jgi:putative ABC transport system permease protein
MAAAIGTGSAAPKARKLAYRNLFHDQLSLFVTLVGIVFSVVLVAVQCSIYLGSEFRIVSVMDHIKTDLWVLPGGTKSFDLPVLLPGREKYAVLSTPGVQRAEDLVVSFVSWRRLGQSSRSDKTGCSSETGTCGTRAAMLIGFHIATNKTLPRDIVAGNLPDLSTPNAVASTQLLRELR